VVHARGEKGERVVHLVPFCECMHAPDYDGGKPMGSVTLTWRDGEYDVLSSETVYAAVANHRRECRLQADMFPDTVKL
jgi:hypothetical protein